MSENNYEAIWHESMNQIHQEYIESQNESYFTLSFNLKYIEDDKNIIKTAVPSDFLWKQMISQGTIEKIKSKITELTGISDIEIEPEIQNTSVYKNSASNQESSSSSESLSEKALSQSKEENAKKAVQKSEVQSVSDENFKPHPQLDSKFTFDTFVPGENSMYAYQASLAAAKNPGKAYTPILLYGGSGLGKTHLMEALGNYIYNERKGNVKIAYISTEAMANEFFMSIHDKTTDKFKKKYRNLDVLLLDDIHFLSEKESLQEELYHTFDSLESLKAQIFLTCDRPISEIPEISDRLRTRFSKGLVIDIQVPTFETRRAILQKKVELMQKNIAPEVLDWIASNIATNVRDLEGALTKIIGYGELIGNDVTVEIAKNLLQDSLNVSSESITVETIQKVVSDYYNISLSEIKSNKRGRKFVFPRNIAIYIARKLTNYSFPEIANEFGGRNHSTIIHSNTSVENQLKTDSTLDSTIKLLIRKIKEYKK